MKYKPNEIADNTNFFFRNYAQYTITMDVSMDLVRTVARRESDEKMHMHAERRKAEME